MATDPSQVVTERDFRAFLRTLALQRAPATSTSLSDYLRALWGLAEPQQGTPVSYGLLAGLLADALSAPPAPFDAAWLAYREPPRELGRPLDQVRDPFGFMQGILLHQIADLYHMEQFGLLAAPSPLRHLGVLSPQGHTWYNIDLNDYLGAASEALDAGIWLRPLPDDTSCDWITLGVLLWLGQIYE
jgi:hypothetical protein